MGKKDVSKKKKKEESEESEVEEEVASESEEEVSQPPSLSVPAFIARNACTHGLKASTMAAGPSVRPPMRLSIETMPARGGARENEGPGGGGGGGGDRPGGKGR